MRWLCEYNTVARKMCNKQHEYKELSRSCCSRSLGVLCANQCTSKECFSVGWDCRPSMPARSLRISCCDYNPQGEGVINELRFTFTGSVWALKLTVQR